MAKVVTPAVGSEIVERLVAALGVRSHWQRIVVEITPRDVIKVYVKSYLLMDQAKSICGVLEAIPVDDVSVDDGTTEVLWTSQKEPPI